MLLADPSRPHETAFDNAQPREGSKVAALDIGSNSFHLVVARVVAGSVQILHRVKQKVRLADGLDDNNILSQEAIDRGLGVLKIMAESLQGFAPDSVRVVATHTLRRAQNASVFITAARDVFPYPIEVISGTEEARLIYSGVAHTSHGEGKRLIIDIGGGSTELVIGEEFTPLLCRSVQIGCVNFTQRFFASGELTAKAFDKAITAAEQELELLEGKFCKLGWAQCIGTSGTIRTLFALTQQNRPNGHDIPVTSKSLKDLMKQFIDAGHVNKLTNPDISDDRRSVIAAGLAILIGIFNTLKIDKLLASQAALREGVLYQMEEELNHLDIRGRTASSLATRYDVDINQANLVLSTTLELYDGCAKAWKLKHKDFRSMLGWAALLHEVGLQINSRGVQRHSAYIISHVDMPGFSQEQQELLATLVRYHRKKIRPQDIPAFYQYEAEAVQRLIALLRLGVMLNIKRQEAFVPVFTVSADKTHCEITFPADWLAARPIIAADLLQESQCWQSLGLTLTIC